ncbi:MAG: hypothetical protein K0S61_4905 [Anaerocolumna sp.]|nr:hypothetical protein [Anaerocolumna sp.]
MNQYYYFKLLGFGVTAYIAFGIRIDIQAFYVEVDSGNKGIMLVGGGGTPNAGISGSAFYNATVDTIFDL